MTHWYWNSVAVEGGGFFQHIEIHPNYPDKVAVGCDIAGWYLWDKARKRWNIIGDFPPGQENEWGSAGFAWHPLQENTFFLMTGKYTTGSLSVPGSVYRSTDNGKTLIKLTNFPAIPFGSNQNQRRAAGSRIGISKDGSTIIIATFSSSTTAGKGIYRSVDNGNNWSQVNLSTLTNNQIIPAINDNNGVTSVCWDDVNPGTVYIAVFGVGVCRSTDYGITWSFIGGAKYIYRIVVRNSIIYTVGVYINSGELLADNSGFAGVSSYNGWWNNLVSNTDLSWIDINKTTGEISAGFPYELNGAWRVSSNQWKSYKLNTQDYIISVPYQQAEDPYIVGKGNGCFKYDPHYPGRVWMGDFYYIWICNNYSPDNPNQDTWISYGKGIENTVVYDAVFIPEGNKEYLYTAWYDIYALKHDRGLTKAPSYKLSGDADKPTIYPSAYGFAYCLASPQNIYVVGGDYKGNSNVNKSTNFGATWTKKTGASPAGRIAVSSTNPNLIVIAKRAGDVIFSSNGGDSYSTIASLTPVIIEEYYYVGQILQADPNNGNRFWILNDNIGDTNYSKLYRLDYNGTNFTVTNTATLPKTYDGAKNAVLRVDATSRIWVSLYDTGLYFSVDNGINFNKIDAIQDCRTIAFGKEKPGSSNKTLYIYGKISNQWSVWESNDLGTTWIPRLDATPYSPFNAPGIFQPVMHLTASQLEYGKLVLGTDGHGAFYSSITPINSNDGESVGIVGGEGKRIMIFKFI